MTELCEKYDTLSPSAGIAELVDEDNVYVVFHRHLYGVCSKAGRRRDENGRDLLAGEFKDPPVGLDPEAVSVLLKV